MGLGLAASGMGMTSFSLGGMVACFRNWAEKLATGGQLEVLKTRSSSKVWDSAKGENKYDIYIICTYTYVCTPAYMHTIAYVRVYGRAWVRTYSTSMHTPTRVISYAYTTCLEEAWKNVAMPDFVKTEPVHTEENKEEVLPGRLFRDPFDQRVFNKFLVDGMLTF